MQTDFLIIGSGISGLNFALNAAKKGKVLIITKKKLIDSNTNYAQGGIAAVLDKTDNYKKHIKDTLEAGSYHNNKKAVEFMVKNSTAAIYRLVDLGVEFAKENGKLKLTKEGGHQKKRIAYVGDYTGKEIERILVKRIKEHPNIKIFEDTFALKLIVKGKNCYGSQVIRNNKIDNIFAHQTILATGGIGALFEHTTNPTIATGDGIAMGITAKCKLKDIEFIQFHPTALDKNIKPKFLVSETVRGEGAKIITEDGKKLMKNKHRLRDLAPRDIVAREIYKAQQSEQVYLDIRHKKTAFLKKRFPKIYQKLKSYKIDMAKDLIPVTPAAHYICGGIVTDLFGRTRLKNLYAFGEVTCTGVHGANRLASNSLLEALVFSNQIIKKLKLKNELKIPAIKKEKLISTNSQKTKEATKLKQEIKKIMWKYAGIIRNRKTIKKEGLPQIKNIIKELEKIFGTNQEIAESRNMAIVGKSILKAAYKRKTSIGCHFLQ